MGLTCGIGAGADISQVPVLAQALQVEAKQTHEVGSYFGFGIRV